MRIPSPLQTMKAAIATEVIVIVGASLYFGGWWGLLSIPVLALAGGSVWALWKESDRVHGALDAIEAEAKKATTHGELCLIADRLAKYADKECYNKHYCNHARRVMAYIRGRIEGLVPPPR